MNSKLFDHHRFDYKGYGMHDSHCYLDIWANPKNDKHLVQMTNGDGTSVTNASEDIATKILNELLTSLPLSKIIWLERYEMIPTSPETIEVVTYQEFDPIKRKVNSPKWIHHGESLTREDIEEFLK